MTTDLRTTLSRHAHDAGTPHLDLDQLLTEGSRRGRRRQALTGAGVGLVALATVAAVAVVPGLLDHSDQALPATPVTTSGDFVYAAGDTIWFDGKPVHVPGQVVALTQTERAAVYATDETVRQVTSSGEVTTLGRTSPVDAWMVSSDSHVAWLTPTEQGRGVTVAVVDTTDASSKTVTLPGAGLRGDSPELLAMDGSTVLLRDDRGVLAWDSAAGTQAYLVADAEEDLQVIDANDGQLLAAGRGGEGPSTFRPLTDPLSEGRDVEQRFQTGRLNADNSLALVEGPDDELGVRDMTSGRWLDLAVPGRSFTLGYRWIDASTFLAASTPVDETDESSWEVRRCTVPKAGTELDCTRLSLEQDGQELVLPF